MEPNITLSSLNQPEFQKICHEILAVVDLEEALIPRLLYVTTWTSLRTSCGAIKFDKGIASSIHVEPDGFVLVFSACAFFAIAASPSVMQADGYALIISSLCFLRNRPISIGHAGRWLCIDHNSDCWKAHLDAQTDMPINRSVKSLPQFPILTSSFHDSNKRVRSRI